MEDGDDDIEFCGPGSEDSPPEVIDRGVQQSYQFITRLGLEVRT